MHSNAVPQRRIGIAHLSLLDVSPPDFVDIAARAGFDFVGLRVRAVTPTEKAFDLQPGSPLLAQTKSRLSSTGLSVVDIEFLLLDGKAGREEWLPMLESGAALNAASMTVAAADPESTRLQDTLSELARDASEFGIRPALEPISYQQVNSLPVADRLAVATGCSVLLDALHYQRFGGTIGDIDSAAPRVPLLQLCDGPVRAPSDREGLLHESRSDRQVPGDGDFPLVDMMRALRPDLPVSVEVPADELRAEIGALEFAERLHKSTLQLIEKAR